MELLELESLINALNDKQISAEDLVRLEAEVSQNPESLQCYLAMMDIENLLHHQCNLNDSIKPVVLVEQVLKHQKAKTWKLVALSTAALLLIGILSLTLFVSDRAPLTFALGPDTQYSLSHSNAKADTEELVMKKGSRLKLEYGTAQLTFASGVKAVIKAPADIEMLELDKIRMQTGTAWYNVPSGAEGFTVLTSELKVVDLGTEFGILASLDSPDEVHVIEGKVQVSSVKHASDVHDLVSSQAVKRNSFGKLDNTSFNEALFINKLPTSSEPFIVLQDQFNNGLLNWSNSKGNAIIAEGDYGNNCQLNTLGQSDHSLLHFDSTGKLIKSEGQNYLVLGDRSNPAPNSIIKQFKINKGRIYTVYFRHAASQNGLQKLSVSVDFNKQIIESHQYDSSPSRWTSNSFIFTSKKDGYATINFNNNGSIDSKDSDTLLDSVLVTSSPNKKSSSK